jgi:hypothetical protein
MGSQSEAENLGKFHLKLPSHFGISPLGLGYKTDLKRGFEGWLVEQKRRKRRRAENREDGKLHQLAFQRIDYKKKKLAFQRIKMMKLLSIYFMGF